MRRLAIDPEQLARFESIAVACSFQKEGSVVLDLLLPLRPDARVFTIDTGVLFPETRETWSRFEEHFGIEIESWEAHGPWSADNCCGDAKVRALARAVERADCWVSGLRREQASTRASAEALAYDERFGLWKANPLVDWTEEDVWAHVLDNDLPYNTLHDQGYDSIGCAPCTVPGVGRNGRWAGSDRIECGLHAA